jgi:hypothetical protein
MKTSPADDVALSPLLNDSEPDDDEADEPELMEITPEFSNTVEIFTSPLPPLTMSIEPLVPFTL